MKANTIWQPYASLLATGAKQYETKSWPTKYRGPIAIHAGLRKPSYNDRAIKGSWEIGEALGFIYDGIILEYLDILPRGCIIATAELVGCHKMISCNGLHEQTLYIETESGIHILSEQELLFGDWRAGRYAWEFANMTLLETPIPTKGQQGLWNWED